MLSNEKLASLREWFTSYVRQWKNLYAEPVDAFELKDEHTARVCAEMELLSESLGMDQGDSNIAAAAALLHDVARFEQYHKYGTFKDGRSEDHGDMGAAILEREKILDGVHPDTARVIIMAVKHHNKMEIPAGLDERAALFAKMTRDADKLDILSFAIDYYNGTSKYCNSRAVELDLDRASDMTPEIIQAVSEGRKISMASMRTINDFKLLQISWACDLNFPKSRELFLSRDYIGRIASTLPQSDELRKAAETIKNILNSKP